MIKSATGKIAPSRVTLLGPVAIKIGPETLGETRLMRDVSCFVTSFRIGNVRVMRRGDPVDLIDLPEACATLHHRLHGYRVRSYNTSWRDLLIAHLRVVYPSGSLIERVRYALPIVGAEDGVMIHGDATVANIVRVRSFHDVFDSRLRWIDPMTRPYVPGSPHVDLGKAYQSCWGYERVTRLATGPFFDTITAARVRTAFGLTTEADHLAGDLWCAIHLARLLRYHNWKIEQKFREVLEDHYEAKL
jgi:hypothetical protein